MNYTVESYISHLWDKTTWCKCSWHNSDGINLYNFVLVKFNHIKSMKMFYEEE